MSDWIPFVKRPAGKSMAKNGFTDEQAIRQFWDWGVAEMKKRIEEDFDLLDADAELTQRIKYHRGRRRHKVGLSRGQCRALLEAVAHRKEAAE